MMRVGGDACYPNLSWGRSRADRSGATRIDIIHRSKLPTPTIQYTMQPAIFAAG
ncbi:hypothetical protein QT972_00860 [Microcoleus sp. herbarium7]